LWPLFALLAVIFFTSRLARNSEIISILSAKVSYSRLLRPYMISAGILSTLLWIGNNYVIPNSNLKKNEFESKYIRSSAKQSISTNIHIWVNKTDKIYIRSYSAFDSSGRSFRLERFKNNELIYALKSNRISFVGRPHLWRLEGYEERKFDGMKETLLIQTTAQKDTSINIVPEDFTKYTKQMEVMNTSDLKSYLASERNRGIDSGKKYVIELYRRTADPFTIFILTLIGVAIASRKVRGGMGFHLAAGVIIGAVYVILSKFSTTFSTNMNFSPSLGVWTPNIFFSMVAWYLVKTAQK
jgi:lipopolysaccharide export system permease protein